MSRREFVKPGTGPLAAGRAAPRFGQGPTVLVPGATKPVVIASANGHKYKNGGPRTCVEEAFDAHDARARTCSTRSSRA